MRYIKVLLMLFLFILGLLFFVQNSEALGTHLKLKLDLYYGYSWEGQEIPFYFVVLASFGVGVLFATAYFFLDRVRLGCALVGRKRAVRSLEKQVAGLKAQVAKEAEIIEAKSTEIKELPQAPIPVKDKA